jgi:hypothetical protein
MINERMQQLAGVPLNEKFGAVNWRKVQSPFTAKKEIETYFNALIPWFNNWAKKEALSQELTNLGGIKYFPASKDTPWDEIKARLYFIDAEGNRGFVNILVDAENGYHIHVETRNAVVSFKPEYAYFAKGLSDIINRGKFFK